MNWRKGIVIRFHSNTLTVRDLETNINIECYLPGKFKLQKKFVQLLETMLNMLSKKNHEFGVIKKIFYQEKK